MRVGHVQHVRMVDVILAPETVHNAVRQLQRNCVSLGQHVVARVRPLACEIHTVQARVQLRPRTAAREAQARQRLRHSTHERNEHKAHSDKCTINE